MKFLSKIRPDYSVKNVIRPFELITQLNLLGLTGGPRGAVQGAVIRIIFGVSAVPKVADLLW